MKLFEGKAASSAASSEGCGPRGSRQMDMRAHPFGSLLAGINCDSNVKNVIETEDCVVLQLFDESGEGTMTAHKIFDGAFLMYSDMHLKEGISYFQSATDRSLLYIDHCREGRIESEIGNHAYSYLQEHEIRVDDRHSHSGRFYFPLCHYYGMTLGFDLDIVVPALKDFFGGFSVDLYELQKKYCNDKKPFVIHNEPGIEHIFSELYFVPQQIIRRFYVFLSSSLSDECGGHNAPAGFEKRDCGNSRSCRI